MRWPCASPRPRQLADAGVAARVVSMPSWDRFEDQTDEFRATILPPGVPVLSVEAGSTFGWAKWADESIGIDRFGAERAGRVRPRVTRDQRRPRRGVCERPDRGIMNRPGRSRSWPDRDWADRSNDEHEPTAGTLRRTGPEPLARQPQAGIPHLGRTRRAARPRHPRAHLEPVHLPEGDPGIERLRRPVRRTRRRGQFDRGRLLVPRHPGHPRSLRRVRLGVRGVRRRRRFRERRGRTRPRPRRIGHRGRGTRPPRTDRPAQSDGQDPRPPPKGSARSSR